MLAPMAAGKLTESAPDVDRVVADLGTLGVAVVEGALDADEVASLRAALDPLIADTPQGRNPFEGFETRRLYSPLAKTRALDDLVLTDWVGTVLDRVIGPHTLSSIIGIDIGPGEVAQELHYDAAAYPLARSHGEVVVNVMWALDDFTDQNGATLLYPESHLWSDGHPPPGAAPLQATMQAGSALLWTGRVVHGGGANLTGRPRLGLVTEYVAGWLRPHENIQASIPVEVARTMPPRLQELIGYHLYPAYLGYVDGRHPRRVLDSLPTDGAGER